MKERERDQWINTYSHDLAHGKNSYLFLIFFDLRVGILAHGKLKNLRVRLNYVMFFNFPSVFCVFDFLYLRYSIRKHNS